MAAHNNPERVTAQIACEAIIDHEHDGYTLADMCAVMEVAHRHGVAPFYVEMLAETIERLVAAARAASVSNA